MTRRLHVIIVDRRNIAAGVWSVVIALLYAMALLGALWILERIFG